VGLNFSVTSVEIWCIYIYVVGAQKDSALAVGDSLISDPSHHIVPLYLIVAMDLNRGIGQNGHLPWNLPLV